MRGDYYFSCFSITREIFAVLPAPFQTRKPTTISLKRRSSGIYQNYLYQPEKVRDTTLHRSKDLAVSPLISLRGLTLSKTRALKFSFHERLCSHLAPHGVWGLPITLAILANGQVSGLSSLQPFAEPAAR